MRASHRRPVLLHALVALVAASTLVVADAGPAAAVDPPPFLLTWGSAGTGDGQFGNAHGVATDSVGDVYVTDRTQDTVQKFRPDGTFVSEFGSTGSGNGQLDSPRGISVSDSDVLYIADTTNHRIAVFGSGGGFVTNFGSNGSGDGQFAFPTDVAVAANGNLYVADQQNNRVQVLEPDGDFVTKWGTSGTGDGEFAFPQGIAVDQTTGDVYVADTNNRRVQKFDSDGDFITKWGSLGTGDGQFNGPVGIFVDGDGEVFVSEIFNDRVQQFEADGDFIAKWGTEGSANGEFVSPENVTVDASGSVYVADTDNDRVQRFGDLPFTVTKTADQAAVEVGEDIDWHITIDNTSQLPVTGITVTDEAVEACEQAVPDLAAGEDHTIDCSSTAVATPSFTNLAFVDSDQVDDVGSNEATVTVNDPTTGVAGTVTVDGSGTPIEDAWVVALNAATFGFAGGDLTDASGEYVVGLPPDDYKLEFIDPSFDNGMEWFDDHDFTGINDADSVTVIQDQTTTADAALSPAEGQIAGTVTEEGTGTPLAGVWVAGISDLGIPTKGAVTDANGDYTLAGVPTGNYYVIFLDPIAGHTLEFFDGQPSLGTASLVPVLPGQTADVDATLVPG